MLPIISHFVYLQHRSWARVYLNDVPVYRSPFMGPESRSGPVNHLLRQGENEITVELLRTSKQPGYEQTPDAFAFELYTVNNLDAPEGTALDRTLLSDVRYPKIFEDAPERFRRLPLFHRETFTIADPLPLPRFFEAPAAEFDCNGLPEQRQVVVDLHRRLAEGDSEGFLAELSLRFDCDERAYPGEARLGAGAKMQQWRDELFPYDLRPDGPLDLSKVHFEPRCGGRVAHVTRHDDRYVLEAACTRDPNRRLRSDLLMIQHGGRWRVFA